ncbi:cation diffusion facilitator family transporter [Roseococcus sp. SYP-B2431]|uniref:cation diffusion facilitator family transporter n=1 Tax=Roseococcus sp. SYP-B2431 TaxID=2496640 RepID=UPI0013F4582D|nr:cation transporter [Roseococcus sp. SYP-B2431]
MDTRIGEAAIDEREAARARERAMLTGSVLDVSINLAKLVAAIWANSLTLLGDWLRGALLTVLDIFLFVLLRKIHRGRIGGYDYGTRKLEQFLNLVVGAAMILAALWLAVATYLRSGSNPEQSETGLLFALAASGANLAINGYVLRRLWRVTRDGTSVILGGQLASRLMKTLASIGVALAVGVNAAFHDMPTGAWADTLGSLLVLVTMVGFGVKIVGDALPHLLDRALGESRQAIINNALASQFEDYDELCAVRTRTEGRDAWIEIEVGFAPSRSLGEVEAVAERLADHVRRRMPQAQVLVIPRVAHSFKPGRFRR